jgi:hypothetical protein
VREAFARSELGALEFLVGVPEYKVALPGGQAASQTDLLVLARTSGDETAVIAVEGKVREPFGDNTVGDWRAAGGSGREQRLRFLREILALPDDEALAGQRYQLLHRTASPLIEAKRLNATHAVMLVHSFGGGNAWFDEFASFASALGADVKVNAIVRARNIERSLHLGWISDPVPEDA